MPAKNPEPQPGKPVKPAAPEPQGSGRKPWKKKTPVEIVLQQGEKLREEIADLEAELQRKRKQLQKFDAVRKLFENG